MHIASTINPNTNSAGDVSIILLSLEATRVFVGKPWTYEKLEKVAREEFSLADNTRVFFETSTLDICQGQNVRISKFAYRQMWQCLDALSVVLPKTTQQQPVVTPVTQVASPPVASTPYPDEMFIETEPASPEPQPEYYREGPFPVPQREAGNDANEVREWPRTPTTRPANPKRAISVPFAYHKEEPDDDNGNERDDGREDYHENTDEQEDSPAVGLLDDQTADVQEPHSESGSLFFEAEDDDEGEDSNGSTAFKNPPPLVKQESLDDQEWEEARSIPPHMSSSLRPRAPLVPTSSVMSIESIATSSAHSRASDARPPRLSQLLTPRSPALPHIYPPISRTLTSTPSSQNQPTDEATPRVTPSTINTTTTATTATPSTLRFLITISHPPTNSSAIFKTRGGHLVRKVLTAACAQFVLDPTKATLVEVLGEGERSTCAPELTIAACGINDKSELVIIMDDN